MGDVLLACAATDRSRLEALAKAFIDDGHRVGWQHEALWTLAQEVCVVAAWSRNSIDARWLVNLARGAARRGKLVSIRLDESDPPRGLKRHGIVDLSMWPARTADQSVDRLLSIAAEVSASVVRTPQREGRSGLIAVVLFAIAFVLGLVWWQGGSLQRHASDELSSRDGSAAPRPAPSSQSAAGGAGGVPPAGTEPPAPRVESTNIAASTSENEATFLGDLALEQLMEAMAGDAQMMVAARANAERALVADAAQPAARLALAALIVAMDLDWQQGRQFMDAARSSDDPRLAPLATGWLRMYGEGEPTVPPSCDDAKLERIRSFVDLAPTERLGLMNDECFLGMTQTDAVLRTTLGIEHE